VAAVEGIIRMPVGKNGVAVGSRGMEGVHSGGQTSGTK